jgi:hypothetical protein
MKPHIKRCWAALAGAIIALTATPTLVAHAADTGPDFDVLSVTGNTNFNGPIQLVGGSGGWTFSGFTPCAEVSGGIEVNTSEIIELGATCSVVGNGTYASIVCGTMTIAGSFSVSLTVTVPFTATETWTTSFTAIVVDGHGEINGTSVEGTSSDGDTDGGTAWTTTGAVDYTPNGVLAPPNCVGSALTALSLNVAE